MVQYYFHKDQIHTPASLVRESKLCEREMLARLVEILQRKELLSDADLAKIVGIEASDLTRSPF